MLYKNIVVFYDFTYKKYTTKSCTIKLKSSFFMLNCTTIFLINWLRSNVATPAVVKLVRLFRNFPVIRRISTPLIEQPTPCQNCMVPEHKCIPSTSDRCIIKVVTQALKSCSQHQTQRLRQIHKALCGTGIRKKITETWRWSERCTQSDSC